MTLTDVPIPDAPPRPRRLIPAPRLRPLDAATAGEEAWGRYKDGDR